MRMKRTNIALDSRHSLHFQGIVLNRYSSVASIKVEFVTLGVQVLCNPEPSFHSATVTFGKLPDVLNVSSDGWGCVLIC